MCSVVGSQVCEGLFAIVVGGAAVEGDGVEAGVAEEVRDQHWVGAGADELGGEGVAQDVGSEGLVGIAAKAGLVAQGGDDGPRRGRTGVRRAC